MVIENNILKSDRKFDPAGQPDMQLSNYIFAQVEKNLQTRGDSLYLTDYATKKQIRHSEVIPMVNRIANGITKRGFQPGDMVCMYANNHVEFLPVMLAAWRCGGGLTTLRTLSLIDEVANQCKVTGARFLCCDSKRAANALAAAQKCPTVKEVWCLDTEGEGLIPVSSFLAEESTEFRQVEVDMDNTIGWVVNSSGSTGAPKGVVYTHRGMMSIAYCFEYAAPLPPQYTMLYVFVFAQIAGLCTVLTTLFKGMTTISMSDFDEDDLPAIVAETKPQMILVFPHHMVMFTRRTDIKKYDLSSVIGFASTGAAWNATDERLLFEVFPNLQINNVNYGMSEVGSVAMRFITRAEMQSESYKPCCSGSLELGAELKIVKSETGEILGPNQEGEMYVKTTRMMQGYLNSPQLTKEFFKDGWAYTGDIGYYDEKGDVFVTGRSKDLIKYRMVHVAPLLIENLISTLDYIEAVSVVGLPDDIDGELPAAAVVLKPGKTANPQDIIDIVAERMSDVNRLRGGVYFLPSIHRDAVGKTFKREVLKIVLNMSSEKHS